MKNLRSAVERLRQGRPGRRFRQAHAHARNGSGHTAFWRGVNGVLGVALVAVGLFLMAAPGPGVLVTLLGLVLLATVSRRTARLLDRGEIVLHRTAAWLRRKWTDASRKTRWLWLSFLATVAAALGYGLLRITLLFV